MPAQERIALIRRRVRGRFRGGAVSVEMAIVAPILMVLLFGTIEMGALFRDALTLNSACREGARAGALGATTNAITQRVRGAAPGLLVNQISTELQFRTFNASSGWSAWTPLSDLGDGSGNGAPNGAQIRVSVQYPHRLITGGLFSHLATDPENNAITVRAAAVMMRE